MFIHFPNDLAKKCYNSISFILIFPSVCVAGFGGGRGVRGMFVCVFLFKKNFFFVV